MTRPDKHAARFGDRYVLTRFLRDDVLPIIRRISEGLRNRTLTAVPSQTQPGRIAIVPTEERWTFVPHTANMAAPTVAELEAGIPIAGLSRVYRIPQIPYPPELGITPADQATLIEAATGSFWHEPPEVGSTVGRMGGHASAGLQLTGQFEAIEFGPRPARSPAEFVQYADDVLDATRYDPMYPEPHEHTDEPWPYEEF